MDGALLAGAVSGVLLGGVLRRVNLCFHSMFRGLLAGRFHLAANWALGVGVAAVGLSAVYGLSGWDQLNRGLPFDPVRNILGGLIFGVGMVVALSCASGLFYKLGAGMLGAVVGLAGLGAGEQAAGDLDLPGEPVLDPGEGATVPGVLDGWLPVGVPRLLVALLLLGALVVLLRRYAPAPPRGRWSWAVGGVVLGAVTTAAWALAGWSGADFGPSTVGASTALLDGLSGSGWDEQGRWQLTFLGGIILGSLLVSASSGRLRVRGEDLWRYGGLAVGGFLLGAGGRIGGGCNLGHGLSGVAQMSVASFVAVASMVAGVWLAVRAGRLGRAMLRARSEAPGEVSGEARAEWRADGAPEARPR